jgi:endoglucanase
MFADYLLQALRAARRGFAALLCCAAVAGTANAAGCLDSTTLRGVNLSGAEFANTRLPGVMNKDYVYPMAADLQYFRSSGMNVVRIPFLWERIQRQPMVALDPSELAALRRSVDLARSAGLCVLLDLHNFGSYFGQPLGSAGVPTAALTDVWLRLAGAFPDADGVMLGLMNEPAAVNPAQWIPMAQATVLALRKAGARQLILVPSPRWSGAHEWATTFDGVSAAAAFVGFQDPLGRYAIELHQYADANYSGTSSECIDPDKLTALLERASAWARRAHVRFFMGEFGVASNERCLRALRSMLDGMQDPQSWLGWTYWSAGPWWGNYPFSIQPGNGPVAPQLEVLRTALRMPLQAAATQKASAP